jgi:predicted restriction endonuclease
MNYIKSILTSVYHKIPGFKNIENKCKVENNPQPKKTKKQKNTKYKKKTIPKTIRNKVWRKFCGNSLDSRCFCCQGHLSYECWEAGHVIPESKGGSSSIENLRPICLACNRSMGTMNMFEFMKKYKLSENK